LLLFGFISGNFFTISTPSSIKLLGGANDFQSAYGVMDAITSVSSDNETLAALFTWRNAKMLLGIWLFAWFWWLWMQ
jgi:hypothetical protein